MDFSVGDQVFGKAPAIRGQKGRILNMETQGKKLLTIKWLNGITKKHCPNSIEKFSPIESKMSYHVSGSRRVHVYCYIKALTALDCVSQTFHLQYHMYLQWQATESEHIHYLNDETNFSPCFKPRLVPSNARHIENEEEEVRPGDRNSIHVLQNGDRDVWNEVVNISDGVVLFALSRKYHVVMIYPLELSSFPFDFQFLSIFFESMTNTEEQLLFPTCTRSSCVDMELGTMASCPDFTIHCPTIEFKAFGDEPKAYSCATITIPMERRWFGFFWRIIFPCSVIATLNLCIFAIDNQKEAADRLSLSVSLLLSMVAFQYVIKEAIPSVPYMTIADAFVMAAFSFNGVMMVYICVASITHTTGEPWISPAVDKCACGVFFVLWCMVQATFAVVARRAHLVGRSHLGKSFSELSDAGVLAAAQTDHSVDVSDAKVLYTNTNGSDTETDTDTDDKVNEGNESSG